MPPDVYDASEIKRAIKVRIAFQYNYLTLMYIRMCYYFISNESDKENLLIILLELNYNLLCYSVAMLFTLYVLHEINSLWQQRCSARKVVVIR